MNNDSTEGKQKTLGDLTYPAMLRAAKRARDIAIETNTYIVVVIDGRLTKIYADQLRAERELDRASSNDSA